MSEIDSTVRQRKGRDGQTKAPLLSKMYESDETGALGTTSPEQVELGVAGEKKATKIKTPKAPFGFSTCPPIVVWLNPLVWLVLLIDFVVGLILWPLYIFKRLQIPNPTTTANEDGGWRHTTPKDAPGPGIETCYDCYQQIYTKWADKNFQGVRTFLGQKDGKKMFGETVWTTYKEAGTIADKVGAGLVSLGCKPNETNILIFEETCKEWSQTFQGCITQSITLATAYATLGLSAVAHVVDECDIKVVVCNYKNAQKVVDMAAKSKTLTHVVYTNNYVSPENKKKAPNPVTNVAANVAVMSFEELIEAGAKSPVAHTKPKTDANAVIMYTSGSTGPPKGVMLTHKNCAAAFAGLTDAVKHLPQGAGAYVNYLPMAHILALCAEFVMAWNGSAVGYADPKSISSKGACRQRPDGTVNELPAYPFPPGAIQEFKPCFFVAVPKIWDILKKSVEEKVGGMGPVIQHIFLAGYAARYFALKRYGDTPVFNILFKKIQATFGGNIQWGASGGGPLAEDVQEFARVCLNIQLIQGYGLTETAACGTIQSFRDSRGLIVGPPQAATALKVEDCAEICDPEGKPYLASDTMHMGKPCKGRGEILIKGPTVAAGYYKRPEETAKAFQKDGWFRTGDIGLFTPDCSIQIIDRVKNLVKLKGGEYIPLEAMEREYATSVYCDSVSGGVMAYGDGDMDRPVLMMHANVNLFRKKGDGQTVKQLCESQEVNDTILADLQRIGKANLARNAVVVGVHLIPGSEDPDLAWTPENGCQTASNKLQRNIVKNKFAKELAELKKKGIQ